MKLFTHQLLVVLSIFGCVILISEAVPGDVSRQKCDQYKNTIIPEEIPKIVGGGGVNAKRKELPFMAALGYGDDGERSYQCGGSLISESFVLTAAHCLYTRTLAPVKYVRFGDLNINNETDDDDAQEFHVKKTYVHPEYDGAKKYHDIALILLDGRVNMTPYVRPVCLNLADDLELKAFYAAGWGRLGYGEDPSDHLQVLKLQHYDLATCQKTFPVDVRLPAGIMTDSQICAGPIDHLADTCEGDSGGPLAYKSGRSFYLAGITSFGQPCVLAYIPAVYTRVSNYVEWIENIVWPKQKSSDGRIHFLD